MAKRRSTPRTPTIDEFFEPETKDTPEVETPKVEPLKVDTDTPQPLKKAYKKTPDEIYDSKVRRAHRKTQRDACKKAHSYLWKKLQEERQKVWGIAIRLKHLPRNERVRRTWLSTNEGGLLPFSKDEILPPSRLDNVFEYQPYIAMRVGDDEAQRMIMDWFSESMPDIEGEVQDITDDDIAAYRRAHDRVRRVKSFLWY